MYYTGSNIVNSICEAADSGAINMLDSDAVGMSDNSFMDRCSSRENECKSFDMEPLDLDFL